LFLLLLLQNSFNSIKKRVRLTRKEARCGCMPYSCQHSRHHMERSCEHYTNTWERVCQAPPTV